MPLVVAIMAWFSPAARADATIPGALWTVPMTHSGPVLATPTGNLLTSDCASLTPDGAVAWRYQSPVTNGLGCQRYQIGDAQGNTYIWTGSGSASTGGLVQSLSPSGAVRWATSTPGVSPSPVDAVLGADGRVYFAGVGGLTDRLLGFNQETGAVTLEKGFHQVTGLHAYSGGLVVVNTDSEVNYLAYDGTLLHLYQTGSPISAVAAYSNAAAADGTVFLAGYSTPGFCDGPTGGVLSVEKFTPAGLAWTWTDSAASYCTTTDLAGTPDGGVILARGDSPTMPAADFRSFSAAGNVRWQHSAAGPEGPGRLGSHPLVDVNGVVAMASQFDFTCPSGAPQSPCQGSQVEFVSQQSDTSVFPTVRVTDPANFGFLLDQFAIDSGRAYLPRDAQTPTVAPSVSAFAVPGLGADFRIALQAVTTGTGTGSLTPPSDGGGLNVGPPAPAQPLPVALCPGCSPVPPCKPPAASGSQISVVPTTQAVGNGGPAMVTAHIGIVGPIGGQPGKKVTLKVECGPNAGQTKLLTTAPVGGLHAGDAAWTYTGAHVNGTDIVSASFMDSKGKTQRAIASVLWVTPLAPCDPGSDTGFLNIAGTTFSCILSGDVYDDPTLLSAKKACVIKIGLDFPVFTKVLKLGKYANDWKKLQFSISAAATEIRAASYPGKVAKDAAAVDDLSKAINAIANTDQGILTIVSSRRVLGGLIIKLSKGSPDAVKAAQDLAVLSAAVTNFVDAVSGISDIQDCVLAFNGP